MMSPLHSALALAAATPRGGARTPRHASRDGTVYRGAVARRLSTPDASSHRKCIVGAVAISAALCVLRGTSSSPRRGARDRRSDAWCATLALWPLVWFVAAFRCQTTALVGLLWPYGAMACDVWLARAATEGTEDTQDAGVALDAGTVTSLSFALLGVLGASDDPWHKRLFVAPVVLFVATVLPQPRGAGVAQVETIRHAQRAIMACATGMVLTGVLYKPILAAETDDEGV